MHALKAALIDSALLLMPHASRVHAGPAPPPAATEANRGWVRIVPKPVTIPGRLYTPS